VKSSHSVPALRFRKKQRDFLLLYAATGFDETRQKECLLKAGYSKSTAKTGANRILNMPVYREFILGELEKQNISAERVVSKIDELLDCKHPFRSNMPDNKEQRETVKMLLQVMDAFPPKKVDIRKTEARYELTGEDLERLNKENWGDEKVIEGEVVEEENESV